MTESQGKDTMNSRMLNAIYLLSSMNDSRADLDECEDRFLHGLSSIFENEYTILLLTDTQGGVWATRKIALQKEPSLLTDEIELTSGILYQSYQDLKLIQFENPDIESLNISVDVPIGRQVKSIACAPLVHRSELIGIVAIGNSTQIPLDEMSSAIFLHLLDSLAARIHSAMLIQDLETSNSYLSLSQKQLINSRNTLRTLFDNIPESFYIVDENYTLVAVNQSRAKRANNLPKQLVGIRCFEGLFNLNSPCPGCLVADTLSTKSTRIRTVHHFQKDHTSLEWEINTYPVPDTEGRPGQVILLEQNITEKRKLEAELIQSEKLAAVGQLAAGVAHEINNPLTSIIANAQILIADLPPDNEDLLQSAHLIEIAGIKATQVVKNLLGSVRKEEFDFEPIDLNESIQGALMLLSHEFLSRNIAIAFDRGNHMPKIVASDNHLQSIWVNLIMNSIEAIGDGSGKIQLTTHFDGTNFLVKVTDTGKGIPDEYIGQIFEPFFTTKRSDQGTGLGLSLVRRVVQAHNGQILVESEEGKGTTFTIVLPREHLIDAIAKAEEQVNSQQSFAG